MPTSTYGSTTNPESPTRTSSSFRNESASSRSSLHESLKAFAGVAGNVLEWYDFAVFGYFSDILATVFFPPDQPGNAALIESFAVFGGAFIMRPIGGIFMGYLGDVYGRKTALEVSIFLMAFPTFLMGCLPTYEQVGAWSYILLIVVRLLQGLSVGGQLMSSLVFTLEGRPKKRWGLIGSYVMATANFGTLLGGVIGYILRQTFEYDALRSYGWRIPFLSGILVSLCGFYLKFYCDEDESFHGHEHHQSAPKGNPIKLAFQRKNLRQLMAACLIPVLWSGGFYLSFVWMAIFEADLIPNPLEKEAFGINSVALLLSVCLLFPIAGGLSDKIGRRTTMTIGGVLFGTFSPFLVMIIGHTGSNNAWVVFFCQFFMGICLSFWGAPMMAWLVEYFEPEARLTSAAVGFNIGQAMVGGFTPAMATYMVDRYGYLSPGWILTGLASIALFGLWVVAPEPPANTYDEDSLSERELPVTEKRRLLVDSYETASISSASENSLDVA